MTGKSRQQGSETAGHIAYKVTKQRVMSAGALLMVSFLYNPGSQETVLPIVGKSSHLS